MAHVLPNALAYIVGGLVLANASASVEPMRGLPPKWPAGASPPVDPNSTRSDIRTAGPVVQTVSGPVQGVSRGLEKKTVAWWGIPFAQPPVGDLRLRAPQPLNRTWTKPLEASKIPPSCVSAEDCLYLNVYAPSAATKNETAPRPVMVWIYGGGYEVGSNWEFGLYDGRNFVEQHQVVLVAMNYRLGNLGFTALDALKQEDPHGSTGNYGVQDQKLALRWVKDNIAGFGGDPGRVTIFGESAGGFSVMWHLVSPASKGLFHAAIMESGTSAVSYFFQPFEKATLYHEERAEILGCPASAGAAEQLKCLRTLSMHSFLHGAGSLDETGKASNAGPADHSPLYPVMPVGPVIDGTHMGLLDVPIRLVKAGTFNKVPLITGSNENGGSIFEPLLPVCIPHAHWPASVFPKSVETAFKYLFGPNASKVSAQYAVDEFKKGGAAFPEDALLSRMVRDLVFMCPVRSLASLWAEHAVPVYMYVFHFKYGLIIDNVLHLGDFHAGELPFVFKNWLWAVKAVDPLGSPQLMSDILSCKWASFAYTHSPNGGKDESKWPPNCLEVNRRYSDWPRFSASERNFYSLKIAPEIHEIHNDNVYPDDVFPRDPKCDLWDELAADLQWASPADEASAIIV